jgi:hypothetical protein
MPSRLLFSSARALLFALRFGTTVLLFVTNVRATVRATISLQKLTSISLQFCFGFCPQDKTHDQVLALVSGTPPGAPLEIIVHAREAQRSGRLAMEAAGGASGSLPDAGASQNNSVLQGFFGNIAAVFDGFDSAAHCAASLDLVNSDRNR